MVASVTCPRWDGNTWVPLIISPNTGTRPPNLEEKGDRSEQTPTYDMMDAFTYITWFLLTTLLSKGEHDCCFTEASKLWNHQEATCCCWWQKDRTQVCLATKIQLWWSLPEPHHPSCPSVPAPGCADLRVYCHLRPDMILLACAASVHTHTMCVYRYIHVYTYVCTHIHMYINISMCIYLSIAIDYFC